MQVRRSVAALAFAALTFSSSLAAAADDVLNLYIWSDYLASDTLDNFTAETGIKVNVDFFDSSEMLEAKMLTGRSGYDVIVPNAPILARMIAAGLLPPLDISKLPNLVNQDADLLLRASVADPRNRFSIIYLWGTSGLGYNVAKVAEILGDDAPTDSWALLFDPANAEKLSACGIYVTDSPSDAFEPVLSYLGRNPRSQSEDDYNAAADLWGKIRPYITKFHSSEYIGALANGDICLAMGYSGDVFQAADRAAEAGNGVEIAYSIPKEGAFIWFDFMAIPGDAPHPDAAHAFINYILKPEVIAAITNEVYYANANAKAAEFVNPEILADPAIYPSPEKMENLFLEQTPTQKVERMRTRLWSRIKSGM